MDVGNFGEMADGVAIFEHGEDGVALADIAIDKAGAVVVAGLAVDIQDKMSPIEKRADDESSDPPAAAGYRDAKRLWHLRGSRLTGNGEKCANGLSLVIRYFFYRPLRLT